jgi:hypothetical protein
MEFTELLFVIVAWIMSIAVPLLIVILVLIMLNRIARALESLQQTQSRLLQLELRRDGTPPPQA